MTNVAVLWTEYFGRPLLTDWLMRYLETELAVRFYGETDPASSTIAHRFVTDDDSGTLVLRIRREPTGTCRVELIATTEAHLDLERVRDLRSLTRNALQLIPLIRPTELRIDSSEHERDLALVSDLEDASAILTPVARMTRQVSDPLVRESVAEALESAIPALASVGSRLEAGTPGAARWRAAAIVDLLFGSGSASGVPSLVSWLEQVIALNPTASTVAGTFEEVASRFVEYSLYAMGGVEPGGLAVEQAAASLDIESALDEPLTRGRALRPALTRSQLNSVLAKLNLERQTSAHHGRGLMVVGGKAVLALHWSVGSREVPGMVAERLRRSLLLEHSEFSRLVRCDMTREEYVDILVERQAGGWE